jgi:hypothetical protein
MVDNRRIPMRRLSHFPAAGALAQAAVSAAAFYVELFDATDRGGDVLIEKIGGLTKQGATSEGERHVNATNGGGSFSIGMECELCDSCQADGEAQA